MTYPSNLPDDPSDSPRLHLAEAARPERDEASALHATSCEDWPCCGHERGDCFGRLYGSDEAIKAAVYARWDDPDVDPMDPMYDEMGWS